MSYILYQVLTICPTPNSLSLVFREKDLLHFTKYVNYRSQDLSKGPLYTVNMTYIEHSSEDADGHSDACSEGSSEEL